MFGFENISFTTHYYRGSNVVSLYLLPSLEYVIWKRETNKRQWRLRCFLTLKWLYWGLGWRPLGQNNSFALSTQPFLSHIRHHKIKDMKYLNIKIKYQAVVRTRYVCGTYVRLMYSPCIADIHRYGYWWVVGLDALSDRI